MPQMGPIYWVSLLFFMFSLMILVSSILYFLKGMSEVKSQPMSPSSSIHWKW